MNAKINCHIHEIRLGVHIQILVGGLMADCSILGSHALPENTMQVTAFLDISHTLLFVNLFIVFSCNTMGVLISLV